MSKKLLISTVAALALSSAAMAAPTSILHMGDDHNISYEAVQLGIDANTTIELGTKMEYDPAPTFHQDDTVTFTIKNGKWTGGAEKNTNKVYLAEQNTSNGNVADKIVAKPDDWGTNYIRFKFVEDMTPDANLSIYYQAGDDENNVSTLVDTNITGTATACKSKISISVTDARNSTGEAISKALANADNASLVVPTHKIVDEYGNNNCPTATCEILLPDEIQFVDPTANGNKCPTCIDENKPKLVCTTKWGIDVVNGGTVLGAKGARVKVDLTGDFGIVPANGITQDGLTANEYTASIASDKQSAVIDFKGLPTYETDYTTNIAVTGKDKIDPTTFAATFKLYNTENKKEVVIGKAAEFQKWVSQGKTLFIPYVSGDHAWSTMIRISVAEGDAEAPIQATVTSEKGDTVTFDLDKKAPKNGAVVLHGEDIYNQAVDAGYPDNVGKRMNVKLKVKSTGKVTAVAYMTDAAHNGSQRKLPVNVNGIIW